ncbi:Uncharacterised protein [Klebsiella pneumoniae]|nr:Uncharacterised protein [Klebsiella pneumoniae]
MGNADKVAAAVGGADRSRADFENIRAEFCQFGEILFRPEHEHAAVPVIFSGGQIGLRTLQVRLLDKAGDLIRRVFPFPQRITALDIAVAGFGGVRNDTEGDQMVSLRILLRDANGVVEDLLIIDDVVRCQDKHQRVIAILRGLQRREGDGRCRVAAHRLEDDIF